MVLKEQEKLNQCGFIKESEGVANGLQDREETGAKKETIPNLLAQSPIPTHSNQATSSNQAINSNQVISSNQATSCGAF